MVDLLFLAHNRLEFTKASIAALRANTDWHLVSSVLLYDDNSTDGTRQFLEEQSFPARTHFRPGEYGSPVAVLNDAVTSLAHEGILAKIDSDTMVPPSWLTQAHSVLRMAPDLDLLGIEAHYTVSANGVRGYEPAEFVGGIGLFRLRAFVTLPRPWSNDPTRRFHGFQAWQTHALKNGGKAGEKVKTGWIRPSLPVFLLDRIPFEPWASLSAEYVRRGWQRDWPKYPETYSRLWEWWKP